MKWTIDAVLMLGMLPVEVPNHRGTWRTWRKQELTRRVSMRYSLTHGVYSIIEKGGA
jgi:hypothetical protein